MASSFTTMKRELINKTGRPEDEHLIVFPNGQLQFYLPSSAPDDMLVYVASTLEDEYKQRVRKWVRDNPR